MVSGYNSQSICIIILVHLDNTDLFIYKIDKAATYNCLC